MLLTAKSTLDIVETGGDDRADVAGDELTSIRPQPRHLKQRIKRYQAPIVIIGSFHARSFPPARAAAVGEINDSTWRFWRRRSRDGASHGQEAGFNASH